MKLNISRHTGDIVESIDDVHPVGTFVHIRQVKEDTDIFGPPKYTLLLEAHRRSVPYLHVVLIYFYLRHSLTVKTGLVRTVKARIYIF